MRARCIAWCGLFIALLAATPADAAPTWANWDASRFSERAGAPVFTVGDSPFYVFGAAFFYERTPQDEWRDDLLEYKRLGINTIDLYLIWNWHETAAGTFDFTGRTNPRRDLHYLFATIHELGLKAIVRPGPVIRNEWRNGGYPDWLLERPEYNMPLHDVLEGRYPATATYQNANADAAAGEWLRNATHLRESSTWLRTVLHEIEPWSHDVIAIALDDDQGAYIDNDTWPAHQWHTYMNWLRSTVQNAVGTRVPLFINTYQMKVTASAPVWAWGNWYQSDATLIGDHDLSQLAFSTALLQTQPHLPVMASEFQAGWLQGADEVAPRRSDSRNTTIALHEMLQLGVHGVVNFPLADTLNPGGWEAPWANWFYAWDAAFSLQGERTPRGDAVGTFGNLLERHGAQIARMQPQADIAIAWLPSAYDPASIPNDRIAKLAATTIAQLQRCRALARTCRLVDLKYDSLPDLQRTEFLVLPDSGFTEPYVPEVSSKLASLRASVRVLPTVDASVAAGAESSAAGIVDAALLIDPLTHDALFDTFNATPNNRTVARIIVRVGKNEVAIPGFTIPPYSARDVWIHNGVAHAVDVVVPAQPELPTRRPTPWRDVAAHTSVAYALDVYSDGEGAIVLDNGLVRIVVVPNAGARAFVFESSATHENLFTTIGALRDDVAAPSAPSSRDYIAAYTHPIEAGTFNRPYDCRILDNQSKARVRCTYVAPDLDRSPVRFEKTFELAPDSNSLSVTVRATVPAVSLSALAPGGGAIEWPRDPSATHREDRRVGYRLERFDYPANRPETLIFTIQGAASAGANRR